ncbi:MAG: SHOCT domain-containing protein [Chromatiales bacterium]
MNPSPPGALLRLVLSVCSLLLSLAIFSRPASAIDLLPDLDLFGGGEPDGTYLFEGGRQYVKLVKQESRDGTAAIPNDHPVELTPEQVRTVLEAITIQHTGGIITEKQEALPLFSAGELSTLNTALSRGLERAKPVEDIIFVVGGSHPGVIAKENKGSSGRVFYLAGKLNLILGDVQRMMESQEQKKRNMAAGCGDCPIDERVDPFRIASRYKAGKLPGPVSIITGLDFGKVNGKTRGDWLILDVPKVIAAVEKEKNKLSPSAEKAQREARLEAARAAAERRQMREEMARMRKEMQERGAGSSAASVEQRLANLDKLKEKGLISADEYEKRRQEILNDI